MKRNNKHKKKKMAVIIKVHRKASRGSNYFDSKLIVEMAYIKSLVTTFVKELLETLINSIHQEK